MYDFNIGVNRCNRELLAYNARGVLQELYKSTNDHYFSYFLMVVDKVLSGSSNINDVDFANMMSVVLDKGNLALMDASDDDFIVFTNAIAYSLMVDGVDSDLCNKIINIRPREFCKISDVVSLLEG